MRIPIFQASTARRAVRSGLVALAALGLLGGSAGTAGAAEGGLVDAFAYESPTYGYAITWDRPWEPDEESTFTELGLDMLTLESFGAFLQVVGFTSDVPPEDLTADWVENGPVNLFDEPEIVAQGEEDGVAYVQVAGEMDGDRMIVHVEAREIAEGEVGGPPLVTMAVLFSSEVTYENNAASAVGDVAIDGDPVFFALDIDGAAEDEAGSDGDDEARDEDDHDGRNAAERHGRDDDEDDDDA